MNEAGADRHTLTVHIGTHKTASSTMQQLALKNRERLLAAGTLLVGAGSSGLSGPHHNLAHELTDRPEFSPGKGTMAEAEREIAASGVRDALISSEKIGGSPGHEGKYRYLRAMADRLERRLRVVVVLREQLSYLNSIYAFRARRFAHSHRFEPFVRRTAQHPRLRYPTLLEPWAAIADELVVLKFGSGVVGRFFDLFGVTMEEDPHTNTSVGPKTVEALRVLRHRAEKILDGRGLRDLMLRYQDDEEPFRARTDAWGWNADAFWGFDDALADEVAAMFVGENELLFERHRVDFRKRGPNRPVNVFDPSEAGPGEREEYRNGKRALWKQLRRLGDRAGIWDG